MKILKKIKSLLKRFNEKLLYEGMECCLFCKHWGVVNWCNLKNERTYSNCTCDKWEILK